MTAYADPAAGQLYYDKRCGNRRNLECPCVGKWAYDALWMPHSKLRRQIAWEAARLMHSRQESEFPRAKIKAAEALGADWLPAASLPTDATIRRFLRQITQQETIVPREGHLPTMAAKAVQGQSLDRFQVYEALLLPLENVRQDLRHHPEGDALYHSLQVFDHARDELPYDEEFLTAALLHDVGKGIDIHDHVAAGLEALEGTVTVRTAWLIEHHMLAHSVADQTVGSRAHRRLRESEHYEDLILLGECDRAGRQAGVEAPELAEALAYLREMNQMFG